MNIKVVQLIKNVSYTFVSNLISLCVSTFLILIIPKFIDVETYGYLQLYLFYSSFVGFFLLGWNDGIYLRYGGSNYSDLDRSSFFSQIYMAVVLQGIISTCIIVGSLFIKDQNRFFILIMLAAYLFVYNMNGMLSFVLMATNRVKEAAQSSIISRILYLSVTLVFIGIGIKKLEVFIFSILIGQASSLICVSYFNRDIVFRNYSEFKLNFKEAALNIRIGSNLMFANIANMLIVGVFRLGIERSWNISTFGKISLVLSVSSLLMIFINAIGVVIFPVLRRTNHKDLSKIYVMVRDILTLILFGTLILYYPCKIIIADWLPKYRDGFTYLAILFPMCVYEGKMALLNNTYLKTLGKERIILLINIISLILSFVMAFFATVIFKNLNLTVVAMLSITIFRCVLAEFFLFKYLGTPIVKNSILELGLTLTFISFSWFVDSWSVMFIYVCAYSLYIVAKQQDIKKSIAGIKHAIS